MKCSSDRKEAYGYQRESGRRDKLGIWDYRIHSTIYKINNKDLQYGTGAIFKIGCLMITCNEKYLKKYIIYIYINIYCDSYR